MINIPYQHRFKELLCSAPAREPDFFGAMRAERVEATRVGSCRHALSPFGFGHGSSGLKVWCWGSGLRSSGSGALFSIRGEGFEAGGAVHLHSALDLSMGQSLEACGCSA